MKRISAIFVLLLVSLSLPAASPVEPFAKLFAEGNDYYQKGNYDQAEQCYGRLLQAGADSAALYYNLGNTCFKQKRLGEAIYYWEKARRKRPADTDIRENLELANLLIVDRIESPSLPLPIRFLERALSLVSITQLTWLVLALFMATNGFFIWYVLAKRHAVSSRALLGGLTIGAFFLLFGCTLAGKIYNDDYRREGVIVEQKVDVRSGPGADNITIFTIHEGTKVQVRGSSNGWCQVSLPNGWNGWLQQRAVAIL
jgi:tetratricopeptide (TPR) repeat protein